jgi:S-DNA-T family DNA segregation ATPase FtsK/SpoIIIE
MGSLLVEIGEGGGAIQRLDLAKAPHLLVAGMTGSGKSAFINALLCDLITNNVSEELGLLLIDPKRVELSAYRGLPHLLCPPVFEVDEAKSALGWAAREMDIRFGKISNGDDGPWSKLVVVIDELANLILADKEIEKPIVRIASMGRAAGVHLVLATQRPSADVLTGLIRANVPTRICLPVVTRMDSRIILDEGGGERLVRPGEMLARLPGSRDLLHLQGRFVNESQIATDVRVAIRRES